MTGLSAVTMNEFPLRFKKRICMLGCVCVCVCAQVILGLVEK